MRETVKSCTVGRKTFAWVGQLGLYPATGGFHRDERSPSVRSMESSLPLSDTNKKIDSSCPSKLVSVPSINNLLLEIYTVRMTCILWILVYPVEDLPQDLSCC